MLIPRTTWKVPVTGPEVLLHSQVLGQGLRLWRPLFRAWGLGCRSYASLVVSH